MAQLYNWHDDWILDNYTKYLTWSAMVKDYNKIFNESFTREQFKNHIQKLNLKLATSYAYTEEMDNFIREYYPTSSAEELEERFNSKFKQAKTYKAIRQRAFKLGLSKTSEYIQQRQVKAGQGRRVPVGTISTDASGLDRIKVGEGRWVTHARYIYEQEHGKLPEGYAVMFLDGNNQNKSIDNLIARPEGYNALLTQKLQIDRSCPELTKTAVLWCDLYLAMTNQEEV